MREYLSGAPKPVSPLKQFHTHRVRSRLTYFMQFATTIITTNNHPTTPSNTKIKLKCVKNEKNPSFFSPRRARALLGIKNQQHAFFASAAFPRPALLRPALSNFFASKKMFPDFLSITHFPEIIENACTATYRRKRTRGPLPPPCIGRSNERTNGHKATIPRKTKQPTPP